mmetsp:Transcript_6042/g.10019  ORF Transcript_6042/g.10019 Transcript_6042/m.10019 type:complete len:148 (-) Transcript_6042:1219-1662(-)
MVIYKMTVGARVTDGEGGGGECATRLRYTYHNAANTTAATATATGGLRMSCASATSVASVAFDSSSISSSSSIGGERIVDVTYPNQRAAVHSRLSVLGDDSVLVKYLNPRIALITTISTSTTSTTTSTSTSSTLYWTLYPAPFLDSL